MNDTSGTEAIRFVLNGSARCIDPRYATCTVLDYVRDVEHLKGTKEGCAEGDCGSCMVLVGEHGQRRAVNGCLRVMGSLQDCEVTTIEGIADKDLLHPVQEALVAHRSAQCGFCTPGVVMSLVGFAERSSAASDDVRHALAGNLCRS